MFNHPPKRILTAILSGVALTAMLTVGAKADDQAPKQQVGTPVSIVPPAMQNLRRNFLRSPFNIVMFRSTDEVYATRPVARGGPVWEIPEANQVLDYSYKFEGNSFTPEQFMDHHLVNAMLIAKDGKIVFERYRNQSDEDDRFIGFSMAKSITSVLIGCALEEGRIKSLDDKIETYLPELKGGGYEGVTIRQLLQMRSGIEYNEQYDPRDTETFGPGKPSGAGVDNIARYVDAAPTVKRAREPGAKFEYKNLNTAVLGLLIERVSGGNTISGYMSQRLWEPLGTEADGYFIMDGPPGVGREFNAAGFNATLRDWARFGLMMLNDGKANGHQIVSPEWVKESTKQLGDDQVSGWGYAYQWWTVPNTKAYAAKGLAGQIVYVNPTTKTVAVILSHQTPGAEGSMTSNYLKEAGAFLAATSAWKPK